VNTTTARRMDGDQVRAVWRSADAVCFDVDSTVCLDEGIDELAAHLGVGAEVAKLTSTAMSGSMTFKEALEMRLKLMAPSQTDIQSFLKQHPARLTPGIREVVSLMHSRNVPVYLISGGFHCIIDPIAETLNIPQTNVYCNRFKFYFDGSYAGFDESEPTCDSGGKPKVIESLKSKHGYKNLVHIGDGATDMEAAPPADAFIGFGGNVVREKVKAGSKWFVTSFQQLIDELRSLNGDS